MLNISEILDWTTERQPVEGQRYFFADTICELAIAKEGDLSYGIFTHRIGNEYCLKDSKTGLPRCANYLLEKVN